MGGIPYVVTAVSPCSGWDLPHVVTAENLATAYLIRIGWFSICYHFCALSTVCDFPHVVTCFSNNSRCYFPCVATAHLISSGWISICCQCSFMMLFFYQTQCNLFSMFCHCTHVFTLKINGCSFSFWYHCILHI